MRRTTSPPPQSSTTSLRTPNNFSKPFPGLQKKYSTHQRAQSSLDTVKKQGEWTKEAYAFEFTSTDSDSGVLHSFNQRGNIDIGIPTRPTPATLSSTPRGLSTNPQTSESSSARQNRTHIRSETNILPFRSANRSNSLHSLGDDESFMASYTSDKKVEERSRGGGGIASWFTGSSAPVTVGVPISQQDSAPMSSIMSTRDSLERGPTQFTELPPRKLQKRPTLSSLESSTSSLSVPPSKPASAGTISSRFNFFGGGAPKTPKTPTPTQQIPQSLSDEFMTLDIDSALFPSGSPSDQDPFSPSAFKNLLMNAEGLLVKIQTAYKIRTLSLHELTLEKEAMKEELEESQTRAQCLKSQLDGMGQHVSDQEAIIAELVAQLAAEKAARAEEKEARLRSVALVHNLQEQYKEKEKSGANLTLDTNISVGPGDMGTGHDRKNWRSSGTSTSTTLEGIEGDSDAESGADSVFSRSMSPSFTIDSGMSATSIRSSNETTPEIKQGAFAPPSPPTPSTSTTDAVTPRPRPVQQKSTFQKILTGMGSAGNGLGAGVSGGVGDRIGLGGMGMGEEGCSNCRGKDSSVAWDTVGLLRVENRELKERVEVLEGGVDGVLRMLG